jgi:hypothetical protein
VIFEVANGTLSVEYRISDGRIDYSNSTIMPHRTINLRSTSFTLTLNFTMRSMLTVSCESSEQLDVVYFGRSRIGNPKAWFSVTAQVPTRGVEVAVSRIRMSYQDPKPSSVPQTSPPAFDGGGGVFEGMLEIDRVVEKSSKVQPMKKAIEKAMYNYTDAWKRRSLRMTAETGMLKSSLAGEVAAVQFLVEDFKWNVAHEVTQLKSQAKGFADAIAEGIADIALQTAEMSKAEQGVAPVLAKGLIAIGIAEVIALAIYGTHRRRRSR